jgi:hypothetical protein
MFFSSWLYEFTRETHAMRRRCRGKLRQVRAGLPLLLGGATQRRRLVADVGALGRTVLLMVMVVLLVMLVRCWT